MIDIPENALPDKPSDLILVALRDLELCELNDNYIIAMHLWHDNFRGYCHVCFAGVVMSQTLKAPGVRNLLPYEFDDKTSSKLEALDEFRKGDVLEGLKTIGKPCPKKINYIHVTAYAESPEGFKQDMRLMAQQLKVYGL